MAYVEGEINGLGSNGATLAYPVMPYAPYGYGFGGNNGGFLGSDGLWAILLFAMIFGWGGNGGFGGNSWGLGGNNMLYDINANTNRGFDNLALNSGIDNLQTTVSNGFANAEVSRCNATTNLLQAINGVNSGLQQCLNIAVGTCAA